MLRFSKKLELSIAFIIKPLIKSYSNRTSLENMVFKLKYLVDFSRFFFTTIYNYLLKKN